MSPPRSASPGPRWQSRESRDETLAHSAASSVERVLSSNLVESCCRVRQPRGAPRRGHAHAHAPRSTVSALFSRFSVLSVRFSDDTMDDTVLFPTPAAPQYLTHRHTMSHTRRRRTRTRVVRVKPAATHQRPTPPALPRCGTVALRLHSDPDQPMLKSHSLLVRVRATLSVHLFEAGVHELLLWNYRNWLGHRVDGHALQWRGGRRRGCLRG